jgi:hypothetical protein
MHYWAAEHLGDKMEEELNITSIQDLLKTVPDPYGDFEPEYTKPTVSISSKMEACRELVELGFDPFKYAKDNLIAIKSSTGIAINVNKKDDECCSFSKIDINDALKKLLETAEKLEGNIELTPFEIEKSKEIEVDNNDDVLSLPNLILAVDTKKILDELSAKQALEDYTKLIIEKKNKALENINDGGKGKRSFNKPLVITEAMLEEFAKNQKNPEEEAFTNEFSTGIQEADYD